MAMESANLLESSLHCCYKCKGLFNAADEKLKHQINCMGNPVESSCAYFACERKTFLQFFQPEDFLLDGCDPPFFFSKDDSFLSHFVKIRVPDIFDPSIFLKSTAQPNQGDVDDSNFLIESNINTLEEETEKSACNTFLDTAKEVDPIAQDQIQSIINKNIEYLKNDDIPSLSTGQSKVESSFSHSQSFPRLLSPIEKHLNLFGDGSKSRLHSPFERSTGFLHDGQLGYSSGSFMYSSNPSIPFSCGLSTDLFSCIPPPQEESQQPVPANIEECPTLQYLDLAKKDPFFGQNPGLSQMNTKDPFLINASFKSADRPSIGLQKSQITRSCEDIQSSPTLQLQDGNYFNFPSTLDEPTQLDYLDLATLDFITNPNLISYSFGAAKERSYEKDEDIYSEDNITCQEPSSIRSEAVSRLSTFSVSDHGDTDRSAFSRVKKKKLRLKKSKSDIERRCENIPFQNRNSSTLCPDAKEDRVKHSEIKTSESFSSFQQKVGRSLLDTKDFRKSRKRKSDTPKENSDTKLTKIHRKSSESRRISKTDREFNVREKLTHLSEEQKDRMKAVLGQTGCIFVKKKRSLSCDEPVVYVNDSQVFRNSGILSQQSVDWDNKFHPVSSHSKSLFDQQIKTRKLTSVLQLKCQECDFRCRSVVELKNHRAKHTKKPSQEIPETESLQPVQDIFIHDSFTGRQNCTEMIQEGMKVQCTVHNLSNSSNIQNIPEGSGFEDQTGANDFMVDSSSCSKPATLPDTAECSQSVFGKSVVISEVTKELMASPVKAVSILPNSVSAISLKLSKSPVNENVCEQYFDNANSTSSAVLDLNKETAMAVRAIENISIEYDNSHLDKELISPETSLSYTMENEVLDMGRETNVKQKQETGLSDYRTGADILDVITEEKELKSTEINLNRDSETFIAVPLYFHEQDFDGKHSADTQNKTEAGMEVLHDRKSNQITDVRSRKRVMNQYNTDFSIMELNLSAYKTNDMNTDISMETNRHIEQVNKTEITEGTPDKSTDNIIDMKNSCIEVLDIPEACIEMAEVTEGTQDKSTDNTKDMKNSCIKVLDIPEEACIEMAEVTENVCSGNGIETLKDSKIDVVTVQASAKGNSKRIKDDSLRRNTKDITINEYFENSVHPLPNSNSTESVIDVHSESIAFSGKLDSSDKSSSITTEENSSKLDQNVDNNWSKLIEINSSNISLKHSNNAELVPQHDTRIKHSSNVPDANTLYSSQDTSQASKNAYECTDIEMDHTDTIYVQNATEISPIHDKYITIGSPTENAHTNIIYPEVTETRALLNESMVSDLNVLSLDVKCNLTEYCHSKPDIYSNQQSKCMVNSEVCNELKETENTDKEVITFPCLKDVGPSSLDCNKISDTATAVEWPDSVKDNERDNFIQSKSVPNTKVERYSPMEETSMKESVEEDNTSYDSHSIVVTKSSDSVIKTQSEVTGDTETEPVHTEMETDQDEESHKVLVTDNLFMTERIEMAEDIEAERGLDNSGDTESPDHSAPVNEILIPNLCNETQITEGKESIMVAKDKTFDKFYLNVDNIPVSKAEYLALKANAQVKGDIKTQSDSTINIPSTSKAQSRFTRQAVHAIENQTDESIKDCLETIKSMTGFCSKEENLKDTDSECLGNNDGLNKEHLNSSFPNKVVQGSRTKQQGSDGLFHCDMEGCQFKTLYKGNVSAHYQHVHLALKRYICDQCAYSTPNMSCLKHHMQLNHYKQKRFKCPDCDYLSLFHSDVVKHVRHTHMKQKQYACNQCEYRTGHSHSLKLHIMSHSGIRPYKCNSCEYRANNTNKVTRHIKLCHANEVGVICEKQDLSVEIDAKQFQCEEIISYQDIKVIELSAEEVNAIMKQKDEKKELDKKAKASKKKTKEAEKRAKEMKKAEKAAEVANISTLKFNKFLNTNDISSKDVKVIKLTPEAAEALMEARVTNKMTTGESEETCKYTKMLEKPKLLLDQGTKVLVTELTAPEASFEKSEEADRIEENIDYNDRLKQCVANEKTYMKKKEERI